jgi:hypothetical protein
MSNTNAGWLTLHEVLEATDLPYARIMALVEEGAITHRSSGAADLFDPDDVERLSPVAARD